MRRFTETCSTRLADRGPHATAEFPFFCEEFGAGPTVPSLILWQSTRHSRSAARLLTQSYIDDHIFIVPALDGNRWSMKFSIPESFVDRYDNYRVAQIISDLRRNSDSGGITRTFTVSLCYGSFAQPTVQLTRLNYDLSIRPIVPGHNFIRTPTLLLPNRHARE